MQEEIDQIKERLDQLENELSNSNSISRNIETAFRERLGDIANSNHSLTTKIINVGGHDVLIKSDAFIQIRIGPTTYYIPTYLT